MDVYLGGLRYISDKKDEYRSRSSCFNLNFSGLLQRIFPTDSRSSLQFFKCYRLTCLVLVFFSGRIMCDPSRKSIFLKNGSANKQSYWETTLVISFRTEVWTSCHLHTTYKGITREPNINSLLDTCLSSYHQDTKVNRWIQYWCPLYLNISPIIPKSRIS